jgi:hypothetical protein
MRPMTYFVAALLIGTTDLYAQSSTAPQAIQQIKAGTYDLEVVYGGGTLEARLDLTASGDSLIATLFVGDHQSPVRAGERKDNTLKLVSTTTALDVGYVLEFNGDSVKGTFTYDNSPGTVTGKRRSPDR